MEDGANIALIAATGMMSVGTTNVLGQLPHQRHQQRKDVKILENLASMMTTVVTQNLVKVSAIISNVTLEQRHKQHPQHHHLQQHEDVEILVNLVSMMTTVVTQNLAKVSALAIISNVTMFIPQPHHHQQQHEDVEITETGVNKALTVVIPGTCVGTTSVIKEDKQPPHRHQQLHHHLQDAPS